MLMRFFGMISLVALVAGNVQKSYLLYIFTIFALSSLVQ